MVDLRHGDCLELMKDIPDGSIDMILADLPYGTTAHKWDTCISLDNMWNAFDRICKPDAIVCLFACQPFTTNLIFSNIDEYRYSWIWNKKTANNFLNANYCPLKITEDIVVFSKYKVGSMAKQKIRYNPQNVVEINKIKQNNPKSTYRHHNGYGTKNNILNSDAEYTQKYTGYPNNILVFERDNDVYHPTQKPVALLEYLIRTYTNPGETVLDPVMGSGSTGVACINTGRDFIGIEKDDHYFEVAKNRIEEVEGTLKASSF